MPEDFNLITLTQEEIDYAIYDAKCTKYYDLKEKQKHEEKKNELLEAVRTFTADELRNYVLTNNPEFKADKQAENAFNLLCLYFANDPEFEKHGYSLKKGILLSGKVGVGKTELLKVFKKNKRQCYHLISVFDIETKCQENGVEYFQSFVGYVPGWGNTKQCFYQPNVGWAFDDVGRESIVFDFGNKSDVLSKIIQTRYLAKDKIPFNSLHVTTNLTPPQIEERYDYAVKSRMREMFNYIVIDGKDRR